MATGGGPGEAGSCSSRLSAEQLKRIEENRRRARERLARRNAEEPRNTARSSSLSQQSLKAPGSRLSAKPHPTTPNDWPSGTKDKTSFAVHVKRPATTSTSSKKYVEFVRPTIKANLMLTSRKKFEIIVPYDRQAIEVFKKTPTNTYHAEKSIWSFGIEVYDKLVAALRRDCRHIELSQIPRPVVALFQSPPRPASGGSGSWTGVGTTLSSTLMQFQREGIDYCIGCGGRALLADDMGLGKTLQALAVMSHYRSNWPLLIICPSSVKMTWAEACQKWISSLAEDDVVVVATGKLPFTSKPVTIISYDLATRLGSQLAQRKPDAIIVDESHFLKNHKTNRCKAILPLVKSATRCLLLSGTPALSRPIELYTQISSLDKSFNVSFINFGIRYCNAVKGNFGWDYSGASNLKELHLYMQEKFMIRRMKIDVLDQLPSKRRQTVVLDPSLTRTQSREVCDMRRELEKAGTCKAVDRHSALLPLFEKTGRLKLPAVRGYILDLLEGGRKLIVFAHHKSVLDSISGCLLDKGYEHIRIDGRTPPETRQLLCDRFQHDEVCLVALLSITTANAGLTLTAASTVVFAELFWNPGILVQAEDRAYRIGQKNSVVIHYLVARDTVDDFIWPLIQSKLTVLNKAGLAGGDFSSNESTVLKGVGQQQSLLDFLDKGLDAGGEGGTEEDARERRGGGSETTSSGDSKKNKRKRPMTEFCSEEDTELSVQRIKLPHSQDIPTIPCQRSTESSMSNGSSAASNDRESVSKKSKSADLASYILSKQPVGEARDDNSPVNLKLSKDELSAVTVSVAGCSRTTEHTPPQHTSTEVSSATTSSTVEYDHTLPCSGGSSTSACEGEWLLEDCNLASFTNFDDDNT